MLADYLRAHRKTFDSMAKDGEIELAEQVRAYNNEVCERTEMLNHIIDPTAKEVHDAWTKRLADTKNHTDYRRDEK